LARQVWFWVRFSVGRLVSRDGREGDEVFRHVMHDGTLHALTIGERIRQLARGVFDEDLNVISHLTIFHIDFLATIAI
jgi:hypothetical protein